MGTKLNGTDDFLAALRIIAALRLQKPRPNHVFSDSAADMSARYTRGLFIIGIIAAIINLAVVLVALVPTLLSYRSFQQNYADQVTYLTNVQLMSLARIVNASNMISPHGPFPDESCKESRPVDSYHKAYFIRAVSGFEDGVDEIRRLSPPQMSVNQNIMVLNQLSGDRNLVVEIDQLVDLMSFRGVDKKQYKIFEARCGEARLFVKHVIARTMQANLALQKQVEITEANPPFFTRPCCEYSRIGDTGLNPAGAGEIARLLTNKNYELDSFY